MNSDLINILTNHLSAAENHTVKITPSGGKPIKRQNANRRKHLFTLAYIQEKYQTIENFLKLLVQQGIKNDVVFTLQKSYGKEEKTTSHLVKEFKTNLEKEPMNTPNQTHTTMNNNSQIDNSFSGFLGSPTFMTKMVEAERSNDYKAQVDDLREELKELRSENRILREKNSSLEIKLQTAEDRKELAIEKTKMESKGFLESPAITALAGQIPQFLAMIPGMSNPNAGALGSPVTNSQQENPIPQTPTSENLNYSTMTKEKQDALNQLAVLDEKILVRIAELAESPEALMYFSDDGKFNMMKSFLN
ncbi:hypothetical protein [Tenacibaculum sp. MAR_2009_124]|uniref:hypothetical protein n=1 Tax=Tenacibaculum sp. MAR_2009_124 TaxID=1250059 RepID=UPI000B8815A4|nr:hypothetical protein [Tenacibaculum sp. MAR_2009_124]